eukprot:1150494-Pelagomonas_calceolata.AAC.4
MKAPSKAFAFMCMHSQQHPFFRDAILTETSRSNTGQDMCVSSTGRDEFCTCNTGQDDVQHFNSKKKDARRKRWVTCRAREPLAQELQVQDMPALQPRGNATDDVKAHKPRVPCSGHANASAPRGTPLCQERSE